MPTEFVVLIPDTLPVGIEGIAFYKAFDQPPQRRTRVEIQQTEFRVLIPETLPVGISGIAWMKPWEPPYFARRTDPTIHPQPAYGTPSFLPTPVSGMAWYVAFDQPKQKRVPVWSMSTSFYIPANTQWKGYYSIRIFGGIR
jgi:hypothetical protein